MVSYKHMGITPEISLITPDILLKTFIIFYCYHILSPLLDRIGKKALLMPVVSRDRDSVKVLFMTTKFKLVKCSNLDGRYC